MHKHIAVLDTLFQHSTIKSILISCAPLNSDVIGVCTITLNVSICVP